MQPAAGGAGWVAGPAEAGRSGSRHGWGCEGPLTANVPPTTSRGPGRTEPLRLAVLGGSRLTEKDWSMNYLWVTESNPEPTHLWFFHVITKVPSSPPGFTVLGKVLLRHIYLSAIIENRFFFLQGSEINIWQTEKLMSTLSAS